MDEQNDTPLCLCTEDQIIDELKRRSDAVVVIRSKPMKDASDKASMSLCDYRGGFIMAIGLVAETMARMNKRAQDTSMHEEPENTDG